MKNMLHEWTNAVTMQGQVKGLVSRGWRSAVTNQGCVSTIRTEHNLPDCRVYSAGRK